MGLERKAGGEPRDPYLARDCPRAPASVGLFIRMVVTTRDAKRQRHRTFELEREVGEDALHERLSTSGRPKAAR